MTTTTRTTCPHCGATVGEYDQTCGSCQRGLSGAALLAESRGAPTTPATGTPGFSGVLIVFALIGAFAAIMATSQATLGASMMAGCCLLAILARIVQASVHHTEAMKRR